MTAAEKLTELRIDNDIKQETIARLLNKKQSAISKYEKGIRQYSIEDLQILCIFYKVSADYILGLPKGLEYPKR